MDLFDDNSETDKDEKKVFGEIEILCVHDKY